MKSHRRKLFLSGAVVGAIVFDPSWAEADTRACKDPSVVAGWSVEHVGPPGLPGAMLDLVIYGDGSAGTGVMQLTQDPTDSVLVHLTESGTKLHSYNVTVPCTGGTWNGSGSSALVLACSNGSVVDLKTGKQWVGKLRVSFDDDDDVLLAKLVQLQTLTNANTWCGTLWYVLGPAPSQTTTCLSDTDCTSTIQPLATDTLCKKDVLYGGQGGQCADPPPPPSTVTYSCSGQGLTVPAGGGNPVPHPWTWSMDGRQSCASGGSASTCVPCASWNNADNDVPGQCVITFLDINSQTWAFFYNPVNANMYVCANQVTGICQAGFGFNAPCNGS